MIRTKLRPIKRKEAPGIDELNRAAIIEAALIEAPRFDTKRAMVERVRKRQEAEESYAKQNVLENSQKSPKQPTTKEEGSDKIEEV